MIEQPPDRPAPSAPRRRMWTTAIVAGCAGVLAGVAAGYVAFAGTSTPEDAETLAQANTEFGCMLAERLADVDDISEAPESWEAVASGYLLWAAAARDSEAYEDLWESGRDMIQALTRDDDPGGSIALAAQTCDEL